MTTYYYTTHSNAAPFFSDTDYGFVDAEDPMQALRMIVERYSHPCGLFSAGIRECSEKQPLLARYLSSRAATSAAASCGLHKWSDDGKTLFVDDVAQAPLPECYELIEEKLGNDP